MDKNKLKLEHPDLFTIPDRLQEAVEILRHTQKQIQKLHSDYKESNPMIFHDVRFLFDCTCDGIPRLSFNCTCDGPNGDNINDDSSNPNL